MERRIAISSNQEEPSRPSAVQSFLRPDGTKKTHVGLTSSLSICAPEHQFLKLGLLGLGERKVFPPANRNDVTSRLGYASGRGRDVLVCVVAADKAAGVSVYRDEVSLAHFGTRAFFH